MLRRVAFIACSLSAGGVGVGCFSHSSRPTELTAARILSSDRASAHALPEPTKDDVALVDGRPLSLTVFIEIRAQLETPTTEVALWAGTAALALQSAASGRGQVLDLKSGLDIARYALGELSADEAGQSLRLFYGRGSTLPSQSVVRQEIERLLTTAIVRRNNRLLASLDPPRASHR